MLGWNIGPRRDYHLVVIRIFAPAAPGEYPVELSVPGWRDFPPGRLRVDHAGLGAVELDPQAYGRALGEALFADAALGRAYRETVAAIQGRGEGLRVCLRLDPPELQSIHWERVYHPRAGAWYPLAVAAATPFARYVAAQGWECPLPVAERPLRVLAIAASPAGLDRYRLDPIAAVERLALHGTLDDLADLEVTYLETGTAKPPTLSQIRQALAADYHLVHFLCHGASTPGGTVLYLENRAGAVEPVRAERLVDSFRALATPPVLCFLAACESAHRGRHNAFVPLAPALVEGGGVQAVVAMTDRVGLETARLFVHQFYVRLLRHGMVDLAVNEARALVQDQWDWGAPVLFSRLYDNRLIGFPAGRVHAEYLSSTDTSPEAAPPTAGCAAPTTRLFPPVTPRLQPASRITGKRR